MASETRKKMTTEDMKRLIRRGMHEWKDLLKDLYSDPDFVKELDGLLNISPAHEPRDFPRLGAPMWAEPNEQVKYDKYSGLSLIARLLMLGGGQGARMSSGDMVGLGDVIGKWVDKTREIEAAERRGK